MIVLYAQLCLHVLLCHVHVSVVSINTNIRAVSVFKYVPKPAPDARTVIPLTKYIYVKKQYDNITHRIFKL